MTDIRVEKDTIGFIDVPNNKLWGAQTQRSLRYFNISTEKMPAAFIKALAITKKAAATVNMDIGLLSKNNGIAIIKAADEILAGRHINEFPLVIWQTGSGTQTNMNMNEVLANRGSELLGGTRGINRLIHPNDDVNKCQSSNDVFPTAMNISAVLSIRENLLPELKELQNTLKEKTIKFKDVIKIGRTHLQDAIPLTLGQEISGWLSMLINSEKHIKNLMSHISELAIGGTAVGTGLNASFVYAKRVAKKISELTNQPFITALNKFEAIATCDGLVYMHGALKGLAVSLMKIVNDIRLLSSGPRCGIGEIFIPENEPGSSIMPGKVNPTQCESLSMICAQVIGNDVSINIGGSLGNLELNVFRPMLIYNFLQSVQLLSDGMRSFNRYCVVGIKPNYERIKELLYKSLMLVTVLNTHIGYDKSAEIAKKAYKENLTLKESALALNYLTEDQFNELIRPEKMIGDVNI